MLLGFYLVLVVALPLALGVLVAFRSLPRSRRCPRCNGEMMRVRSRSRRLISRALPREELQVRWCPPCAWTGTVRVRRRRPLLAPIPAPIVPIPEREPGLNVRRIQLDDGPWRVRLECWAEQGTWRGRLLFVGPAGRAWSDGRTLLTGRSAVDVLSQVLSLSDQALVGRIRKATR